MNENINQNFEEDEEVTVTLTLDDGEIECQVVTVFTAGGRDYIALLPMEGPEKDTGSVYLYRYVQTGDNEPEIENIDSDEEYELASDAFDEYLDSAEFDELVEEDEEEN